jgi:hypothetical protein
VSLRRRDIAAEWCRTDEGLRTAKAALEQPALYLKTPQ